MKVQFNEIKLPVLQREYGSVKFVSLSSTIRRYMGRPLFVHHTNATTTTSFNSYLPCFPFIPFFFMHFVLF